MVTKYVVCGPQVEIKPLSEYFAEMVRELFYKLDCSKIYTIKYLRGLQYDRNPLAGSLGLLEAKNIVEAVMEYYNLTSK